MLQLNIRRSSSRDYIQHQAGRPDFERRRILAHVRVPDDEMESPILVSIRMGFITRIQDRSVMHRVDTQIRLHEVRSLRELIRSGNMPGLLSFGPNLPRTGYHLSAHQKRQQAGNESRKGDGP